MLLIGLAAFSSRRFYVRHQTMKQFADIGEVVLFTNQLVTTHCPLYASLDQPNQPSICMSPCLPACLSICLYIWLPVSVTTFLPVCLSVCLSALTSMIQGHQKPQARRKQGERQHCPACQHISLSGVQFYGPTIHLSENKLCKEAWQSWASSKVDEAPAWFRAQVWSLFYLALDPFRSYHKVLGIQL